MRSRSERGPLEAPSENVAEMLFSMPRSGAHRSGAGESQPSASSPRLRSPPTSPAVCGHTARERNPDLALWKSGHPPSRGHPTQSSHHYILKPYAHVSTKASRNQDTALSGALTHTRNCNCKMGRRERREAGGPAEALTNPQRSEGLGAEDMQTKASRCETGARRPFQSAAQESSYPRGEMSPNPCLTPHTASQVRPKPAFVRT